MNVPEDRSLLSFTSGSELWYAFSGIVLLFLIVSELKIGTQPVVALFGDDGVVDAVEVGEGSFWASLPRRNRSNFLPILRPHVNTFLLSLEDATATMAGGGAASGAGVEVGCWSSSSTMTGTAVTTL